MKKIIGIFAVILFLTHSIQAQEQKKPVQKKSRMTVEQMATLQAKKMTLHLDLNSGQQKEIQALLTKQGELREKKRAEFSAKKAENKAEDVQTRYNSMNERLDNQIGFKSEMKKILTDQQFEKWSKSSQMKQRKGRENMRRGRQAIRKGQKRNHRGLNRGQRTERNNFRTRN